MSPSSVGMAPQPDTVAPDSAVALGGGALGELVRRFDHQRAEPVPAGWPAPEGQPQPPTPAELAFATVSMPGPEPLDVLERALEELLRREAERHGLDGGPR